MKTHDLGKALSDLGKILRSLPNQELDDFATFLKSKPARPSKNIGISLSVLASLSKYTRNDWEGVVRDFDIPVEIRARDATRDIMGKILNYLAENDDERHRVALKSRTSPDEPSELSTALRFLLSHD